MIKLICKGLWNIDVITGDFSEWNEVKVFILANERMCALSALGMSAIRTNDEPLFSLYHYIMRKISFSTLNTFKLMTLYSEMLNKKFSAHQTLFLTPSPREWRSRMSRKTDRSEDAHLANTGDQSKGTSSTNIAEERGMENTLIKTYVYIFHSGCRVSIFIISVSPPKETLYYMVCVWGGQGQGESCSVLHFIVRDEKMDLVEVKTYICHRFYTKSNYFPLYIMLL